MNKKAVVAELVKMAKELLAVSGVGTRVRLLRDLHTKAGVDFKAGEEATIREYSRQYPWVVKLEGEGGKRISLLVESASKSIVGFPTPPSLKTMERWSENGIARSIDGSNVEPDGFSYGGAPSWMLVVGMI
jgi:hypothetical protein